MYIPKIAAVHDLSGVGRCSLTMAIPVLSAMGAQCCPFPTAMLSMHTGYPDYYFVDFTEHMPAYAESWRRQDLRFDAIFTGFLGGERQLAMVADLIAVFGTGMVFIDPVMGDHGKAYPTYTAKMCAGMRELVRHADIITPNVTEACILTDTPYTGEELTADEAFAMAKRLTELGAKAAIITGVHDGDKVACYGHADGGNVMYATSRTPVQYSGTGDLFASVLCGALCLGLTLEIALPMACDFVRSATEFTMHSASPAMDGITFEPLLYQLGGKVHELTET